MGAPHPERVIVLMGSGASTVEETIESLQASGEKVGLLKVRLYRPFAVDAFLSALPASTRAIAVLDLTQQPGAIWEPLYSDVVTGISEAFDPAAGMRAPFVARPRIIGGRFGLSSKEFT